jgi:hypothetical protein
MPAATGEEQGWPWHDREQAHLVCGSKHGKIASFLAI